MPEPSNPRRRGGYKSSEGPSRSLTLKAVSETGTVRKRDIPGDDQGRESFSPTKPMGKGHKEGGKRLHSNCMHFGQDYLESTEGKNFILKRSGLKKGSKQNFGASHCGLTTRRRPGWNQNLERETGHLPFTGEHGSLTFARLGAGVGSPRRKKARKNPTRGSIILSQCGRGGGTNVSPQERELS